MIRKKVAIAPRRSLAAYAALSILMVALSYVVIVLLAAACVMGPYFLASNSTNIQIWALFLGGVVVAATLLWSILPRWEKFEEPGLLLDRAAQPKLFAELEEIAAALNEPMPKEVYLIGNANAFVSNAGGFMGLGSKRTLGIGLPFLSAMTIEEFRAVMAHEFAHYYGGDTRLGPFVYRAQKSIVLVFQNMENIRLIRRIGILRILHAAVTKVVEGYFLFFLRVVNFISRKQEFRADELACIVAGARPMKETLRKVRESGLAWPTYWSTEVVPVVGQGYLPAIGNGFAQFLAAPHIASQVSRAVERDLVEEKTQPFDTHPPLVQRLAAIEKLDAGAGENDARIAIELIENPEELEKAFLERLNPELREKPLKPVSWEKVGQIVMIPSWKQAVGEYPKLFQGATVSQLPVMLKRLPEMGREIRDPKGRLLTAEQRQQWAVWLVGIAVVLALTENGWLLDSKPGSFGISRGGDRMDAHEMVRELTQGKIGEEEWKNKCTALGIGELPLGVGTGPAGEERPMGIREAHGG